jgi:hypothetical protein
MFGEHNVDDIASDEQQRSVKLKIFTADRAKLLSMLESNTILLHTPGITETWRRRREWTEGLIRTALSSITLCAE